MYVHSSHAGSVNTLSDIITTKLDPEVVKVEFCPSESILIHGCVNIDLNVHVWAFGLYKCWISLNLIQK